MERAGRGRGEEEEGGGGNGGSYFIEEGSSSLFRLCYMNALIKKVQFLHLFGRAHALEARCSDDMGDLAKSISQPLHERACSNPQRTTD